jgi:hypothetical protein
MFKKVFELFVKVDKPLLGRWNLKSCNEISTSINSIYQNRDHCGDTICKTPKKAVEYRETKPVCKPSRETSKVSTTKFFQDPRNNQGRVTVYTKKM